MAQADRLSQHSQGPLVHAEDLVSRKEKEMTGEIVVRKLEAILSENELLSESVDVVDILDCLAELGLPGASEVYLGQIARAAK